MKKIYSLIAILGLGSSFALAQSPALINPTAKQNMFVPASQINKHTNAQRTTGTYFIDYEGVQENLVSDIASFVDLSLNSTDTTNGNFFSIWQVADSLQYVPLDYSTYNYFSPSNILNLHVDSAFIIMGHQNNSGMSNKIRFRLTNVVNITSGANTYKDWNTVYWSDSLITDTSLTGPNNGSGYPIMVHGMKVDANVPAPYNFGLEVTYDAPQEDSLAIRYSWSTDGSNCSGIPSNPPATLTDPELYPTAYYSVTLGGGTIGNPNFTFNLPRVNDGAYYWWIDCDGNTSDTPNENPYQYWSIWFKVTVSDNVAVEEQDEKGIHIFNYPNPATESTTINVDLKTPADVKLSLTDLSGKTVFNANLGEFNVGKNTYTLNTSNLAAGVYSYTIDADGVQVTRRMIISK